MAYDQLITMVVKLFNKESIRKGYEDEAKRFEEFTDKVQTINDSTLTESLKQARIHLLLRGLVGANRVNYIEFTQLSTYFNPNTILKDYKIFAEHRPCFEFEVEGNTEKVKNIKVLATEVTKKNRFYWIALVLIFIAMLGYMFMRVAFLEWFLKDWQWPGWVAGTVTSGVVIFLLFIIFRIFLDKEDFNSLIHEIENLNHE
ncbi:hypothetical protein [Acinetobacter baumannii]|uniref:hypothetical protein n=1 Tax=Acinetobacter baumannii TaxID=470 RepID=UPI0002BBF85A|nr:hypothetical protein [Acinetobacter baumannii]